jgi:hypothetical protein
MVENVETPSAPTRRSYRPILAGLAVVVALVVLFRTLPVEDWLLAFREYVRDLGPAGYALYAVVYAARFTGSRPASPWC